MLSTVYHSVVYSIIVLLVHFRQTMQSKKETRQHKFNYINNLIVSSGATDRRGLGKISKFKNTGWSDGRGKHTENRRELERKIYKEILSKTGTKV